ncbi:hypothetical protein [Pseudacidobacterium ailaaui]|jgi:hypothetical protein|uniref:hypothetical protein n=1 Tax=Pseudacidobacterium ailaaui TaxID=1382359 RepID=UPI00047B3B58|nr:hypothetical protein [Pseudacidobacterium ailaaui]
MGNNASVAALVNEAIWRVGGSSNTVSGNCGMFALALARWLIKAGYHPTIGVWSDAPRNSTDILTRTCSIEHVCVECSGKLWDGEGEQSKNNVEAIIAQERGPEVRIHYFSGFDPHAPQLIGAITRRTAHWISFQDFLEEIEGRSLNPSCNACLPAI